MQIMARVNLTVTINVNVSVNRNFDISSNNESTIYCVMCFGTAADR